MSDKDSKGEKKPLSEIEMVNRKEFSEWLGDRMRLGYDFRYNKAWLFGYKMNKSVTCLNNGSQFDFEWR